MTAKGETWQLYKQEIYAFSHCLLGIHSFIDDLVVTDNWEF